MKSQPILLALATVAFAVAGCASIVGSETGVGEGVAYMLPHALLPVELVERGGAFALSVKEPLLVGDPTQRYLLRRSGNAFSSDNVQITVNTATGLLEAVKVESTDQVIPALIKLASAGRAEAADVADDSTLVFRGLLDPAGDVARFNQTLNKAVEEYLAARTSLVACPAATAASDDECQKVQKLKAMVGDRKFAIQVDGETAKTVKAGANCSIGLCYRINLPYLVTLTGPGGASNTVLASLPNGSPAYVLPVERWPFVKTTHDVKLQGGVLQSVTTDRPSSALALAAAPVDATKAVLGAVGEVLQLKIDLSGKEKALADAKVAEINAKAALDKALIDKGGGKAEAAIFGARGERGDLVMIMVGPRPSTDALEGLRQKKRVGAEAARTGGTTTRPDVGAKVSPGSDGTQK